MFIWLWRFTILSISEGFTLNAWSGVRSNVERLNQCAIIFITVLAEYKMNLLNQWEDKADMFYKALEMSKRLTGKWYQTLVVNTHGSTRWLLDSSVLGEYIYISASIPLSVFRLFFALLGISLLQDRFLQITGKEVLSNLQVFIEAEEEISTTLNVQNKTIQSSLKPLLSFNIFNKSYIEICNSPLLFFSFLHPIATSI